MRGDVRQVDAAARSGLTQSKISRAEQGKFTLCPDEAEEYARALRATPAQRRELLELSRAAAAMAITGQTRLVRRGAEIQRRIRILEQQSTVIRSWQPELVPGLLQSWRYTLAVVEREPDEVWATERRARLALIEDTSRTVYQLMSEAVLRWVVGSREVMAEQLNHLITLSHRPNVILGLLPFGPALPPPPPSFHLYEDRTAVTETIAGTSFLDERGDLDAYRAEFDRLDAAALHGDEARDLITSLITN